MPEPALTTEAAEPRPAGTPSDDHGSELEAGPVDARPSTTSDKPWLDWGVVAFAMLVVAVILDPASVLSNTLPWKTDLTGHVVVPWIDEVQRGSWLPGSWSDAMFLGFPVNQLYPWLPAMLAALLALVLPLAVAFKIVVVLPSILLPFAAWRAATWSGVPSPWAPMLAIATLPFLLDTTCLSCGGNVASAVTGEYAFSWSLTFAVLALGAVDRLAQTGLGLVPAALLSTAAVLSHPLPGIWLVIGIFVIAVAREVWEEAFIRIPFLWAAGVTALMASMWWGPFLLRRDWMPILGFPRRDDVLDWLIPSPRGWYGLVAALAVLGAVWAIRRRQWFLIAIAVQTAIALAAFLRIGEGGQLYNLRVLPFWQLGLWLLAFAGIAWIVSATHARLTGRAKALADPATAPVVAVVVAALAAGSMWGLWGVTEEPTEFEDGTSTVVGIEVPVTSQAAVVRSVLGGPSSDVDRQVASALAGLVADVAAVRGCGRVAWDESPAEFQGTIVEVWQLPWQSPLWTDGCITPLTGVLTDSSATAGAALMTQDLVSTEGLRVMPSIPDLNYNLEAGATRMRTMGVRYYLTHGGAPAADAEASDDLELVASAGPWSVWEVTDAAVVTPLAVQPAVIEPRVDDSSWDELSTAYFASASFDVAPLAQDGPAEWSRVGLGVLPPDTPLEPAVITSVLVGSDRVQFDVDRVGVPVLVRVSDYPGWLVDGADGPYRATPNFLVVVPTATRVTLSRGLTPVDWAAGAAGFIGLAALVGIGVFRRLQDRDDRLHQAADDTPAAAGGAL